MYTVEVFDGRRTQVKPARDMKDARRIIAKYERKGFSCNVVNAPKDKRNG